MFGRSDYLRSCGDLLSRWHEARATVDQQRTVATKQGWTVVEAFADRPGADRTQWSALSQLLTASEANLLIVPSFATIADTVPDVLEEIVRLRDAGCDLYVHDSELDTTSPIDRMLFRIADGVPRQNSVRPKPRPPGLVSQPAALA